MLSLCSTLSSLVPSTSKIERWLITVLILPVDEPPIPKSVKYYLHCSVYLQKGIPGCGWINLCLGNILFIIWKFDLIGRGPFLSLLLSEVYNKEENIISVYQCNQRDSVANSGKIVSQMGTASLITDNGMSTKCFCMHSSGQCTASKPMQLDFCNITLGRASGW